ncbi:MULTISPECIES: hypothetical protein [unclassified Streptococcus]|nr:MULTISPECIES: hypothetical protein [unclassified Streptococcus]
MSTLFTVLIPIMAYAILFILLYFVIRLAVKHGVRDTLKQPNETDKK